MRFGIRSLCEACGAILLVSSTALAQDEVAIESKTVFGGTPACSIGVFLSNSTPLVGINLPFELRTETWGAYAAPSAGTPFVFSWGMIRDNRLWNSPLGPGYSPSAGMSTHQYAQPVTATPFCSGPTSGTYVTPSARIDFVSPDAVFLASVSTGDPNIGEDVTLDPGADLPGTKNASLLLVFGIQPQFGTFLIDTCCIRPANHLLYFDENTTASVPGFTAGVVTVRCHHGDPSCDGVHSVLDVIEVGNRAFRGADALNDPSCPVYGSTVDGLTDVNCDGRTDVVDHVKMVAVAFRGANASSEFCNPCP